MIGFWPILLSGTVVLLVAVAILQYNGINAASRAKEMRAGAELDFLMMKWHSDLFAEFSAICVAMQVGPDSGARDTWNDYLERYIEWNNALPHEPHPYIYRNPDLIGDIYIWETNQQTTQKLYLLNQVTKRIEPSKIPTKLTTLLTRLQANSGNLSAALRAWQLPGQHGNTYTESDLPLAATARGTNNTITGWQFDEGIPAIVHPIFHRGANKSLSSQTPVDWIVITLDMNVLEKHILPALAARYFSDSGGHDYRVAVIRASQTPATVYSSDSGFGAGELAAADSTMPIFGSSWKASGGTDSQSFSGPGWFPVIEYGPRPDTWLLAIQRRAGPLQSEVNAVRRNNLIISSVVLLLLAVNIAVLSFIAYRARKFAKLQMDFVASISHELRTPLTAIFTAGENIKDGLVRKPADLAHYGEILIRQSRHLMNHVDRILVFASIRSGKAQYCLRPLLVPDIFNDVRRNIGALVQDEGCILVEHVEPCLPPVLADMFAVSGCLENLITNAIKYRRTDRRIIISAALGKTEHKEQEVNISVEDHGIGIHAVELKHIFAPFYRSAEATANQVHGTGLGLSVAKHLAEAMGGRLSVTSQVGAGSVFCLHLQLAEREDAELASSISADVQEKTG